uniref:POL protein n=1 Tax=Pisaster ochraceus TaxID=7612 RepID=Q9TX38_PISOC|nr:pol gene product {Gypsy/Ty3-class retrotransposon Por2} [Pisaster ochraceus=starfish, testis, sperm, Peptide Transposon, 175 aa] [Pisaster ochraceus]
SKSRVEYFGHVFSSDGVSPDPKKVQAIQNVPEPQNAGEVRSFLGLVTYCGRFIPDLATISAPLRELTKDAAPWSWGTEQQQALEQIRKRVAQCCTMAYFDPAKKTEILVDASPVGLAGILAQHDASDELSIVALASRSLTPVEQRYSQTEREALAITWAILHFHLYVYGGSFTVI